MPERNSLPFVITETYHGCYTIARIDPEVIDHIVRRIMTAFNTLRVTDMSMSIDDTRYDGFAGDILDDGAFRDVHIGTRTQRRNPSVVDKQYTVADRFSPASIDYVGTGKSNKSGLYIISAFAARDKHQQQKKKNG